jgi:hypothetical protein
MGNGPPRERAVHSYLTRLLYDREPA